MAEWSTQAPAETVEWSAVVSSGTARSAHYITYVNAYIARLSDRRICVKAEYYAANLTKNYSISGYYIRATIDGVNYNSPAFTVYISRGNAYKLITTRYFYVEAPSGKEIDVYPHFGASIYGTPAVVYAPGMGVPDIRVMTENGFVRIDDVQIGGVVPDAVKIMSENNEWISL